MAAFTVDETSAPTSIEDSNHQQNGIVVAAGYPRHLTLDVGGRKFKVSCDTLKSESGWFKRQLSGRFGPWEPELDGSYFMDTDPDLFEYLLRFMRRPEVFPLFYSKMNGFDYDLYNRLQAEALYFQTDTLYEWIKDKRYLNAIKVKTSSLDIRVVHSLDYVQQEILPVHKTEELHVVPRTRKVYLCPRQIAGHKGHPELCGAACHKRQADNAVEYEDVGFLQVVSLQKEIVFDEKVCRDD